MSSPTLRAMTLADAEAVSHLADRLAGLDYYPPDLVRAYVDRATTATATTAYVAELDGRMVAFRFAFPPGRWSAGRGRGLSPALWPHPLGATAYFQSCFVDPACTGHGLGGALAQLALDDLRSLGARAVVAHSWKESPHDSSRRYLSRLGFVEVGEHPGYWAEVDYLCSGCRTRPCTCTALEMVLDLTAAPPR